MAEAESLVFSNIEWINVFFSGFVADMVVAAIILLVGFIAGKLAGKLLQKILAELELNTLLKNITKIELSLESFLSSFVTYFIYFMSVVMALNQLGLTTTILYIISAAVIILIVLSIFLSIKDFVPNAIAGIYVYSKHLFKIGDLIKVNTICGKVTKMGLVDTCIETKSGDVIYIPNSIFTKSEIVKVKPNTKAIKPDKKE